MTIIIDTDIFLGSIHLDAPALHLQPVPAQAGPPQAGQHAGHGDLPQGDGRHQEDEEDQCQRQGSLKR